MSVRTFWSLAIAATFLAGLPSCSCDDENTISSGICSSGAQACEKDSDCLEERHACRKSKDQEGTMCCERLSSRKCTDEAGCCPGQTCSSGKQCVDKFDNCETDEECGELGDRFCTEWIDPARGPTMRCDYHRCGSGGTCPQGQACFAGFCVASPPCGGACPAGTACVPQNNLCHAFGDRCDLQPKPGYLVVFTDPDNVYDVCKLSEVACQYAELPPLFSNDLGRHASVAADGKELHVAQYDGQYGDLVVSDYDDKGTLLKSTWLDGIPASGTVVGGPSGARGGIAEPGDDVGRYTSIAAKSDGTLYVAYYDQTNGNLRFVERGADGAWKTPYTVDGLKADVGLYTSLVIDPAGNPAIAYFMRSGTDDTSISCADEPTAPKKLLTAVKLARADKAHPAKAADWTVETVRCGARPKPPCFDCPTPSASGACVVDPTGEAPTACLKPATTCAPACGATEQCVTSAGKAVCAKQGSATELIDLPFGLGLFPSLAFDGDAPVVAWYDRNGGNLMASRKEGTAWKHTLIDGFQPNAPDPTLADTGDVGRFPSLVIAKSAPKYQIAYQDYSRRALRLYAADSLATVANQAKPKPESFIDNGAGDPKLNGAAYVGADASLLVGAKGTFAAYQDSTGGDLKLAKKDGATWKELKAWKESALGFFAQAVEMGGKVYVVHTRIRAKTVGGKPVPDNQLQIEVVAP